MKHQDWHRHANIVIRSRGAGYGTPPFSISWRIPRFEASGPWVQVADLS